MATVTTLQISPAMHAGAPPAFQQRHREVASVVDGWTSWRRPFVQNRVSRQLLCRVRSPAARRMCHASWSTAGTAHSMHRQPLPLIQNHLMGQLTSQAVERSRSVGDVSAFAAATANESLDLSSQLELDNIRDALIRQEDTIIFCVIERAQFAANGAVYQPDAVPVPEYAADGSRYSLLEYILRQTEQIHGRIRRFTSPDEHAFYPDSVPALVLPPLKYPEVLAPYAKEININNDVMDMYLRHLLPGITGGGDDGNYGSAACYDVLCLQALSKRIHYGKFVAEAKFQSQTAKYTELIRRGDVEGIMDALTDRAVELKVVDRVRSKAATYGQDFSSPQQSQEQQHQNGASNGTSGQRRLKVAPDTIAMLYDKWVMPMTKQVQVQYLLRRLDG